MKSPKVLAVIPSRIQSTRLSRKPLVDICGLPMIAHVIERAKMSPDIDSLVVATDDDEIKNIARRHDCIATMTSDCHTTGIERACEAAMDREFDVLVVINGDEPLLTPEHIGVSVQTLLQSNAPTALLATPSAQTGITSDFKVVTNLHGEAMYFSREDIPSPSRSGTRTFLKVSHIIAFQRSFLNTYLSLPRTPLENIEGHDHLRILEHGFKVQIGLVAFAASSVDTPADLEAARKAMRSDKLYQSYKR